MSEELNPVWARLKAPFQPNDIEWRVQRVVKKASGDASALVLAYVTARAIMDRLDEVVGPENWSDSYRHVDGGVVCRLEVRVGDKLVSHEDGAPPTDVEPFKGGISDALKRCAVKFGIGRYLYNLENGWAQIVKSKNGSQNRYLNDKKSGVEGFWGPPTLPGFALPRNPDELTMGSNRGQLISAQNGQYLQNYVLKHAQEISVDEIRACISEFNRKRAEFARLKQAESDQLTNGGTHPVVP
jgi:hypothetical protein